MPDCSLVFPPHPAWVRTAREAVRTLVMAARRSDLAETAMALTSEAVTNAVNACRIGNCTAPVTLSVEWATPHHIKVLVHDDAPGLPALRQTVAPHDESGRGLLLIDRRAQAWGVCPDGPGGGKSTWFVLGGGPPRRTSRSPIDCPDCTGLEAARRKAVAGGDRTEIEDTTVAVRSHFRDEHLLPRWTQ
ncbi:MULTISPECIES: ATP-binding protein [Streptomyces]|uniref:Histidine kinase/HSP90-like ATPase domain-containing protein n=1 Tax=Streptomyces luteosporeus TaxID=173856 RepID=A0ABN3TJK0_9ACTN